MIKEYIKVQLNELIPHARNPRKNDSAVEAVSKSIKETGYITPIIVDENNEILCGHTRAKSLKKLGHSEVEVLKVTGLTDEQKKRYRILDNKTGEVAEWDFEILQEDFKLEELVDLGFDIKDLDQGEVIEDEAPPIPETPKTVKGDIYELNGHRIMCGDSTILSDVEKLMDGNKSDISIQSPPYNVGKTPNGNAQKYQNDNDSKTNDQYFNLITQSTQNALLNSIYSFINLQSISGNKLALISYLDTLKEYFCDYIIWDKMQSEPAMGENILNSRFEFVYVFGESAKRRIGVKKFRGNLENIVYIKSRQDKEFSRIHKATYPVAFASYFIENFSMQSCLDLFLGTGTTLIACEQTNRKCYGMELDEKYCDVIVQRWVNFTKQTKIKRNGIDMEWPTNNQETTKNA